MNGRPDFLNYRRQFIMARSNLEIFPEWRQESLNRFILYAHPDLGVSRIDEDNKVIVLLGEIYDPAEPQKSNVDIIRDIIQGIYREELFLKFKKYGGCYIAIYIDKENAIIFNDARGLREISFCTDYANRVICASQPNLLAEFSSPAIGLTNDPELDNFFKNELWDSRWVGDETCFSQVRHLLPNHYLDIEKLEVHRYWPAAPISPLELEEAVFKSSEILRGMIEAIINRHPVMMGVTAGTDSRVLLAASKKRLDRIYMFINTRELKLDNPDLTIPKDIIESVGYPFHIHEIKYAVDTEFKDAFIHNTFLANERLLPSIYDLFIRNEESRVLILGVSEIGRTFYGKAPRKLTAFRMAYKLGYPSSAYAHKQCDKAIPELVSTAERFNINVMALIYWEQRLGNWGATRNSESLLAVEKIDPFNSHAIYEIFLSVHEKYRHYQHTPAKLYGEMIRYMWPDLLKWPINPPYSARDKIKEIIIELGLYEVFAEIRYILNYSNYLLHNKPRLW